MKTIFIFLATVLTAGLLATNLVAQSNIDGIVNRIIAEKSGYKDGTVSIVRKKNKETNKLEVVSAYISIDDNKSLVNSFSKAFAADADAADELTESRGKSDESYIYKFGKKCYTFIKTSESKASFSMTECRQSGLFQLGSLNFNSAESRAMINNAQAKINGAEAKMNEAEAKVIGSQAPMNLYHALTKDYRLKPFFAEKDSVDAVGTVYNNSTTTIGDNGSITVTYNELRRTDNGVDTIAAGHKVYRNFGVSSE
jgi:hypothetical protein